MPSSRLLLARCSNRSKSIQKHYNSTPETHDHQQKMIGMMYSSNNDLQCASKKFNQQKKQKKKKESETRPLQPANRSVEARFLT